MATWPGTLPQTLLQEGYREEFADNRLRTQMDAGPPKMRRRYTAGFRPVSAMVEMTAAQVATLKTFYNTTIQAGSLPFDWTDPITGGTASFRFVKPPSLAILSGSLYRVSMDLEILP